MIQEFKMKYLTDREIINWNKRIQSSGYMVSPSMNLRGPEPDILYKQVIKNSSADEFVVTIEPFIRYEFTFSISASREEEFFEIFEKLSKQNFGTKSVIPTNSQTDKRFSDIPYNDKIIDDKSKTLHMIKEKEYVRWTYKFAGKLGSIMAYISYLEDTINFFSMIWGYTEEGGEICLLKFPVGTIVSPTNEKSRDFLILDYKFVKLNETFYVDYIASEMLSTGSVIVYGDSTVFVEKDLCFSRNSRIDNLLN